MSVLPTCVYVYNMHACLSEEGKKKLSESLELESQLIVSCHLDAGNWTRGPLQKWQVLLSSELFPAPK